jgi:hypothetical protein
MRASAICEAAAHSDGVSLEACIRTFQTDTTVTVGSDHPPGHPGPPALQPTDYYGSLCGDAVYMDCRSRVFRLRDRDAAHGTSVTG